jgi:outer membrane immunogenic protein
VTTVSFEARSIWTVRGRLGYALDNILLYGTGGFASARSTIGLAAPELALSLKDDVDHTGWVAGVGAEIRLAAHWRLGAEYRYLSFGKATADFFAENVVGADDLAVRIPVRWRAHQALVSLSYQF